MDTLNSQQAIVIGGSMAGMASAEVLSRHFERVLIIERDTYAEDTEYRKGIPQNRQPHALLQRGLMGLEELFSGITQDWIDAGAVSIDFGHEVEWLTFGKWRPHYEPGLISYSSSRPALENVVRRRIQANSKICIQQSCEVIDLISSPDHGTVTGVRVRSRDGKHTETVHEAALVIDTSGRESHTQNWINQIGYDCPERTVVNSFPGYSSRVYERPASFTGQMIYIQPTPGVEKRGAIMLPIEGNRLHVALIGMSKDYPPTDEVGFIRFLEELPEKAIYNVLKDAKPLSPISGYRRAENIRYHYERLTRWPENFVVLGDAVLAFNPVYGQGMTVAVLSALKLGECLQTHRSHNTSLTGFSKMFLKALVEVQAFSWQLATGEDMRWSPETEGCSPTPGMIESFRLGFLKKVMIASTKDPVITEALYRVMNMVATPAVFFRPDMMLRILRAS